MSNPGDEWAAGDIPPEMTPKTLRTEARELRLWSIGLEDNLGSLKAADAMFTAAVVWEADLAWIKVLEKRLGRHECIECGRETGHEANCSAALAKEKKP